MKGVTKTDKKYINTQLTSMNSSSLAGFNLLKHIQHPKIARRSSVFINKLKIK